MACDDKLPREMATPHAITTNTPLCVAPTADRCGEGAVWDAGSGAVYWTDINRFLIHRFRVHDACVRTWFFDEPVTAMVLTDREDTFAVVLGSKVVLWKPEEDRRTEQGFSLKSWPHVRLNDAHADPRGSLWVGSMRNNVNPDGTSEEAGGTDGVLYRIDPDGTVTEWKDAVGISNTLVWSPDRKFFYFADTLANAIHAFEYDEATGNISRERDFLTGFPRGLPDGSTMDAEGYLWNCRWGGACIVRVAPDASIDRVIEMPTANITNCTFGNGDLKTLYVTTAASDVPGDRFAGGLFAIATDVQGQPENRFRVFGAAS
jgi:sugar lactone lactonase YvrE